MKTVIGKFPWKGFAIMPTQPKEKTKKKLDSVGIDYVKGDLKEFITAAKKVFTETPKSAPLELGCFSLSTGALWSQIALCSQIFMVNLHFCIMDY